MTINLGRELFTIFKFFNINVLKTGNAIIFKAVFQ